MRLSVAAAVSCLILTSLSAAEHAAAAVRKQTSIGPQGLGPALKQLATEREFQILYRTELVGERQTAGAVGEFTLDEVLHKLLDGTNLTFQYLDDSTVTILPMAAGGAPGGSGSPTTAPQMSSVTSNEPAASKGQRSFWDRFRLAQAAQGTAGVAGRSPQSTDEPASRPAQIEEVIVTAQQREQALLDVPMAISAITGAELQDRGVDSFQELSFTVPDLRVHQVLPGQNTLALRGIGTAGGSMPLVGVYLDEIAASGPGPRALDLRTTDLQRVEVLHGPQGTLYGQGSAAGTVRFITREPSFDGFGFTSTVGASVTQDGSPSEKFTGVLNMPLVDEVFALRMAGTYENSGGWIDLPAAGNEDINSAELMNVRVKGLLNIGDAVSLTGLVVVHRNEVDSPDGGESITGDAYRPPFAPTLDQPTENDYELYALTGKVDFGAAELLSATSYYDNRLDSLYSTPSGTNHRLFQERDRDKVFNQEVRLASTGDTRFNWTVGAFFRDSSYAQDLLIVRQTNAAGATTVQNLNVPSRDESKSWSYFANASYQLSDNFELGAGARYFDDTRLNPLVTGGQRAEFHSFDPRVYLSYAITDDVKAYASAAKGFRSGGFNAVTAFRPQFEPDEVYSYEAGLKFSAWQSRVNGEVAVYYSEYEDMQLITPVPGLTLTYLGNVGKAEIKGFDWSLTFALTDTTTFGTHGTVVDNEVVEIPAGSALRVGDPLNYVADYNYAVFLQQGFNWSNDVAGLFRVDYSEKDKAQFAARNLNLVNESEVISILYARLGAAWKRFSVDIYADNILNDRDRVAPNIVGFASRPRPRTYGVQATLNF